MRTNRYVVIVFLLVALAVPTFAEGGQEVTGEQIMAAGDYTVWTGERIVFTKDDGADPTQAANQDRITESVWITRGNNGGQIFNIQARDRYSKAVSPLGTAWAVGTTENLESLSFTRFRPAVESPKDVVGRDLVMFIEEERIFIDVRFLSWSQEKGGGFSYERSTPEE